MVIATGFFDGVHIGHRLVLKQLVKAAEDSGDESMVVTFWPHPRNVLQLGARSLRLLSAMPEKRQMLADAGVNHIEVIEFTKAFSMLTTEEYLKQYIIGRFGGKTLVLGYDNRFGNDSSSPSQVGEIAARLGLEVIRADMVASASGVAVSSTKIRSLLESGDVISASGLLGYGYSLYGVVVSGNRIGRNVLGFPTANMQLYEPLKLVPANGVYFVRVETLGGEYWGMCNIGNRPTVGDGNARTIETNIFDFDEDIYGLDIKVTFIRKIRDEIRFASFTQLKVQLERDRKYCKSMI